MAEQKTFTRNPTSGDEYRGHPKDATINAEVNRLLKKGVNDHTAWRELQGKYGNNPDLLDAIFETYKDKFRTIYKKAKKFKQIIFDKYLPQGLQLADIIRKAKKYQKKLHFSDEEFQMFIQLAIYDRGATTLFQLPSTKMARTLGFDALLAATEKLHVKESELAIVEQIKKLYDETRTLHGQVILQALSYSDCGPEAVTGKYDATKHNAYSYVHPVVAALFLGKVKYFDEQMLFANIGYIVTCKFEGRAIMTQPDYTLYNALVSDPNDNVCTMGSPIEDLRNRFDLQTRLWDCVLNLRQGKYYQDPVTTRNFMMAIDNCRNNIYDAPDLCYVKDEGTLLRRIIGAFSIRPTYVNVQRLQPFPYGSDFGIGYNYFNDRGMMNVTNISMIVYRLPVTASAGTITLTNALSQPQWFVENKVIIPKTLNVFYTQEVIMFYVGRRLQQLNITQTHLPFNFMNLPMTVAGWETINEQRVELEKQINVPATSAPAAAGVASANTFHLKSVVTVKKMAVTGATPSGFSSNLIVGSKALVRPYTNDPYSATKSYLNMRADDMFVYDPQAAANLTPDPSVAGATGFIKHDPVEIIDGDNVPVEVESSGCIYIYTKTQ